MKQTTRLTRQRAIDAECYDCSFHPLNEGTLRQQVELNCFGCPLSEYRPVTIATRKLQNGCVKSCTRQEAIEATCYECAYDDAVEGTWRAQVEACPMHDRCSLYPYRPVTNATLIKRRTAKFEAMSPEDKAGYRVKQANARIWLSTGKKQQESHSGGGA